MTVYHLHADNVQNLPLHSQIDKDTFSCNFTVLGPLVVFGNGWSDHFQRGQSGSGTDAKSISIKYQVSVKTNRLVV